MHAGQLPLNLGHGCRSHVTRLNQAVQEPVYLGCRPARTHTPRPAADDAQTTHGVRESRTAVRLARAAAAVADFQNFD